MIAADDNYYYTVEGIAEQVDQTGGLDKVMEDVKIYDLQYIKHDGTRTLLKSEGLHDAPSVFCQQVLNDLERRVKGMFEPIEKSVEEQERVKRLVKRMGEELMEDEDYEVDE